MDISRINQLSPRHRDCLRLVHAHLTTKEIARDLGIATGTVANYLAEAVAILGARNRRHAAVIFHAHDAPSENQGHSERVALPGQTEPTLPPVSDASTRWAPLNATSREADNDYGIGRRLAWVILGATALALGFANLAGGWRTISDSVRTGQR